MAKYLLLTIVALLLLGCKGKRESLDFSQRPAQDAISQPLGRYPLGEPVPIWFDASGIYPSARQSLPDGLAAAVAGTVAPVIAEYSQYAGQFCMNAPIVDSEAAATVRVRLYYAPLGRSSSMLNLANDVQVLALDGATSDAIRQAAAKASQPPNGYSGLAQVVLHGDALVGAQVWLNVWPLWQLMEQARIMYPGDVLKQRLWAIEQWHTYIWLVARHELSHALFGLADEPSRAGPGMMHNGQLSGMFNPAEVATVRWLRSCPARATSGIKITAEDW